MNIVNEAKTISFTMGAAEKKHMEYPDLNKEQKQRLDTHFKETLESIEKSIDTTRVHINIEGTKVYMGFSIPKEKVPNNHDDWISLFEDLIGFMKAPDVADPEVLGEYSPKPTPKFSKKEKTRMAEGAD